MYTTVKLSMQTISIYFYIGYIFLAFLNINIYNMSLYVIWSIMFFLLLSIHIIKCKITKEISIILCILIFYYLIYSLATINTYLRGSEISIYVYFANVIGILYFTNVAITGEKIKNYNYLVKTILITFGIVAFLNVIFTLLQLSNNHFSLEIYNTYFNVENLHYYYTTIRANGFMSNTVELAQFGLMVISLGLAMLISDTYRVFYGRTYVLMGIILVIATSTVSAIISVFVAINLFYLIKFLLKKTYIKILIGLILNVILVFIIIFKNQLLIITPFLGRFGMKLEAIIVGESLIEVTQRGDTWAEHLKNFELSPLIGVGSPRILIGDSYYLNELSKVGILGTVMILTIIAILIFISIKNIINFSNNKLIMFCASFIFFFVSASLVMGYSFPILGAKSMTIVYLLFVVMSISKNRFLKL